MSLDLKKAYEILKIPYKSPMSEVNKSYRSLVRKYHPDKNSDDPQAKDKLMQVKRAHVFIKHIFKDEASSTDDSAQSSPRQSLQQPPAHEVDLIVTLEELLRGCTKSSKFTRKIVDSSGEREEDKFFKVVVKPGAPEGSRYTFPKQGDILPGIIPANVVFVVREEEHPFFKRITYDIEYTAEISSEEAVSGCNLNVPSLEQDLIPLKVPGVISSADSKKIPNRGLPNPISGKRGDLIVRFKIIYEIRKPQEPPVCLDLPISLENVLFGCTKRIKINRKIMERVCDKTRFEDKVLTIVVPSGTEVGARFICPKEGDRNPGTVPADVIMVAQHKPHQTFKVKGVNLEYSAQISSLEARNGCELQIPTLEANKTVPLALKQGVKNGKSKAIQNEGLPKGSKSSKRGDLIVYIEVVDFQDPPIERDLPLTLEQVLKGCTKQMKIERNIFDKKGRQSSEDKILSINVSPGVTDGTRYTFPREGDRRPGAIPADLIFIARDLPHKIFVRKGVDIEYCAEITRTQFTNGEQIQIPTLEKSEDIWFALDQLHKPQDVRRFAGEGLPFVSESANNNNAKRGDLLVRFVIVEEKQTESKSKLSRLFQFESEIPEIDFQQEKSPNQTDQVLELNSESSQDQKEKTIPKPPLKTKPPLSPKPKIISESKKDNSDNDNLFKKGPPIYQDIKISLEYILTGGTKRVKISRNIVGSIGNEKSEDKILELNIKPGIKSGTLFKFLNMGDEYPGTIPADIIFTVRESAHESFVRNGADIEYVAHVTPRHFSNGIELTIPTLARNKTISLQLNNSMNPKDVKRFVGLGLPFVDEPERRGDLVVIFEMLED